MMDAKQARKIAEDNKTHTDEVAHLNNHFQQLIHKATNTGKFTIEKQIFSKDRFKSSVLADVLASLKAAGYKVVEGTNNAQQQITIEVSW